MTKLSTKKHFKKIQKKYPTSDYAIASNYYLGLIEMQDLPKSEKAREKQIKKALGYYETYIEKSPDGRFASNCAEEILKLNTTLKNYDYLIIAKVYYENGEYDKAKKLLEKTTLAESWPEFVKTEFKLKNYEKTKEMYPFVKYNETVEIMSLSDYKKLSKIMV